MFNLANVPKLVDRWNRHEHTEEKKDEQRNRPQEPSRSSAYGVEFVRSWDLKEVASITAIPDLTMLAKTNRIYMSAAMGLQVFLKHHRVINYRVVGGVEQSQVAFYTKCAHMRDGIGVRIEFLRVANLKLLPVGRFMPEPFAQFRTWGNILVPFGKVSAFFADSAWPEAIDKHALPVIRRWRFVNPFYPQMMHHIPKMASQPAGSCARATP